MLLSLTKDFRALYEAGAVVGKEFPDPRKGTYMSSLFQVLSWALVRQQVVRTLVHSSIS